MLLKAIVPAALLSAFMLSPAGAAQIPSKPALEPLVIQTQSRDRDASRPAPRRRPNFRPGHRYRHPPRGWHRFRHRPRDWRSRGCIIIGPVWFCP